MKIATIVGARPQFIKAAAVSRAIATHNRDVSSRLTPNASPLTEILVHTGQHYDEGMSDIFFRELEIPAPKYNLAIGSGPHGLQTGRMLGAIEEVLLTEKPDWVLTYGDTNSTLAGALAAAKLHIPAAHVEAGLRSFNRRMPEEINRIVADQLATLLFCPSQVAVDNLAAEGIPPVTNANFKDLTPEVIITGDVMADALRFAAAKASAQSDILTRLGLHPRGYLLATVHRAENTDQRERLGHILEAFTDLGEPLVFPVHPRTRKLMNDTGYHAPAHVQLIDPVGYFDIIALEQSARLILTDSGGMQKEAYWLEVPCVTLRDETEWVETVASGWNVLTGADRDRIVRAVRTLQPPSAHPPLYGEGRAAQIIIDVMTTKGV